MGDKVVFDHLGGQLVGHGQLHAEHIAAHIADGADNAELAVRFLHNGAVGGGAVVPAADLHNGADGTLPHGAGQVVGQCVGHGCALAGDGIPALAVHGDKLLFFHLSQRIGKLKIVDKLLLQKRALQGFVLYRACHFDKVAEQHTDLRVVCKAAGAHTGGKCFCHRDHFLKKFSFTNIIHARPGCGKMRKSQSDKNRTAKRPFRSACGSAGSSKSTA